MNANVIIGYVELYMSGPEDLGISIVSCILDYVSLTVYILVFPSSSTYAKASRAKIDVFCKRTQPIYYPFAFRH